MHNYTTTSTNDYFENLKYKDHVDQNLEAMLFLDKLNVPRFTNINDGTYPFTIIGRIKWLYDNNKKTDIISPQYALDKSITFEEYCQKYVKVWDTEKQVLTSLILTNNQTKTYNHIENNKHSVINKYRQAKITTLLSAYSVYKTLSQPNINIGYFGVSNNSVIFEDYFPHDLKYAIKNKTTKRIELHNGSKIIFNNILNESNLIGVGYDIIILDEAAFFNNFHYIKTYLKLNGQLIISSTPKRNSDFNKLCIDAFENINYSFNYLKLNWFDDINFNKNAKIDINGNVSNEWLKEKTIKGFSKEMIEEEILGLVL